MATHRSIRNTALALLLGSGVITQAACAQPGGSNRGQHGGPPPAAYQACAELTVGASCAMTGRRGDTLQGSCILPPEEDSTLVCAPAGGPGAGPGDERPAGQDAR